MRFTQPAITTRDVLAKALDRAIQRIRHKGEFDKEIGSKRQRIARRARRKSGVPSRNPYAKRPAGHPAACHNRKLTNIRMVYVPIYLTR